MGTEIKTKEWYSMQDLVTGKYFLGASTFWSVRKIVENDKKGKNMLKAVITGTGRGLKYQFKGENIINFIKAVEAGKVQLQ